jgi:hypothetical protein
MELAIRYLILCDEVQADPSNLLRLNVLGLMTHIRSTRTPPFPVVRPRLCILVLLTGCQGPADVSLRIVQTATGRVIFRNQPRRMNFVSSPREAVGIKFHIANCAFPAEGLYWVELVFSGAVVARQVLSLTT